MKMSLRKLAPVLTLMLCVTGLTTCAYVWPQETRGQWEEADSGWIANKCDSICGLDDPRLLSHPARIVYRQVLDSTPEMKKLREQSIDPASPTGIQLRAEAVDRVRKASESARVQFGHCSVWKQIAHKDGRDVPDLTVQVIALL